MKINDSQESKSLFSYRPAESSPSVSSDSSIASAVEEKNLVKPKGSWRDSQIFLAIIITILSTLWVQITMQRHAPFIRTAQCYFNQIVLEHYSQDIYEGADVIYWRTGEYYRYESLIGVFDRFNQTICELNTNSLFDIEENVQNPRAVQLLVTYGYPQQNKVTKIVEIQTSLSNFSNVMEATFFNRTFYQHIWKVEMLLSIPILYRNESSTLSVKLQSELYSSIMMSFEINVDLLDQDQNPIRDSRYNQNNLGLRKIHDPFNMELTLPFIFWIIVGLYIFLFALEFKYILERNRQVNKQLRMKIREEKRIQKLLEDIGRSEQILKVNDSSSEPKQQEVLSSDLFEIPSKYQISILKRIRKVGVYYCIQFLISLISLITCYNTHNGFICFLAWTKLVVYLTQTKNKFMLGYLLQQALPLYFKILLNIGFLILAFVLFNSIVYPNTAKFQTLKLGIFEYIFNYFQYGIYENFILAFKQYGTFSMIFYFIQLTYLLYIGNNILQSILANQVMKNSYMETVKEMIQEIRIECPACGADQKSQIKESSNIFGINSKNNSQFISKILKHEAHSRIQSERNRDSYQIVVNSPLLSPFFPSKVQRRQSQKFVSPKLKNGKFQKRLKEIKKKLQQQQITSRSKIEQIHQLDREYDDLKTLKLQISQSKIEETSQSKSMKYMKKLKSNIQLLFKKVEKLNEIKVGYIRSQMEKQRFEELKGEILQALLAKIQRLSSKLSQQIQ